jgi:hypothetical protein
MGEASGVVGIAITPFVPATLAGALVGLKGALSADTLFVAVRGLAAGFAATYNKGAQP